MELRSQLKTSRHPQTNNLPFNIDRDLIAVVGLGNPGQQFDKTRHNVGFEAIKTIAEKYSADFKSDKYLHALVTKVDVKHKRLLLVMPQTFMNESGRTVKQVVVKQEVPLNSIVVIHDELDLEVGAVKLKFGGGFAGHNGLKSIFDHCKSNEFARVRIGIGRPTGKGADYVLTKFKSSEKELIDTAVQSAADAVLAIVEFGFSSAQNSFN